MIISRNKKIDTAKKWVNYFLTDTIAGFNVPGSKKYHKPYTMTDCERKNKFLAQQSEAEGKPTVVAGNHIQQHATVQCLSYSH